MKLIYKITPIILIILLSFIYLYGQPNLSPDNFSGPIMAPMDTPGPCSDCPACENNCDPECRSAAGCSEEPVPIDGGLAWLAVAGIVIGIRRLVQKKPRE